MMHPFFHTRITSRFRPLLALVISLFALAANAYDFKVGGLCYDRNDDSKSVTVTYENSSTPVVPAAYSSLSGTLTISSSVSYGGKSYSVTSIGYDAFCGCTCLTSVTIPNSVTSIGYDAFYGCSGLNRIEAYLDPTKVTMGGSAIPYRHTPDTISV